MSGRPVVVFTDLDGTLLDHDTYLPGPARDAVDRLREAGFLVVACSAKTRAEQRRLVPSLGLSPAFVAENGGAVVLWEGFPQTRAGDEQILRIGLPYPEIRLELKQAAAAAGVEVSGYGDVSVAEVAARTGLDQGAAARAREREHSETFWIVRGDPAALRGELGARGLRMVQGSRFWTAQGPHDKGTAIRRVLSLYPEPPMSFALGDAPNDLEMLAAVDRPMLVERPGGGWADIALDGITRLEGSGPRGWVRGAEIILEAGFHTG